MSFNNILAWLIIYYITSYLLAAARSYVLNQTPTQYTHTYFFNIAIIFNKQTSVSTSATTKQQEKMLNYVLSSIKVPTGRTRVLRRTDKGRLQSSDQNPYDSCVKIRV